MKIALLNTLYAPYQFGGAERSVQILAEGLCRRGLSVSVITLGEPHLEARSVINGVTVHRLPLANWYWPFARRVTNAAQRAAFQLRDLHNRALAAHVGSVLDRDRPDILHTNGLIGFSVGVWSQARRRGIRIVHTLRDYYLMCLSSVMYRNERNCGSICPRCLPFAAYRRRASQAVHAVSGVSEFILKRHMREGYFKNCSTAKVIFNPLYPVQRKAATGRTRGLVFGYIGNISAFKGVRWLLESFVQHASRDDSLVLAGGGDPRFLESMKSEFSSSRVTFLGHTDAKVFYERVDVVVVPSLWHEPFGRTAIEPWACGIPVIASNRGARGNRRGWRHRYRGRLGRTRYIDPSPQAVLLGSGAGCASWRQLQAAASRVLRGVHYGCIRKSVYRGDASRMMDIQLLCISHSSSPCWSREARPEAGCGSQL